MLDSAVPDPSGQNGSSVAFESTTTYDLVTGLPLTTTDANGQVTQMQYNDPMLRPTRVIPPSGGAVSEMIYNDTPGAMWVKTRTQVDAANWKESIAYADGLGRTVKTQSIDNQGDVFSETVYNEMSEFFDELKQSMEEGLQHAKGRRNDLRTTVLPLPPKSLTSVEILKIREKVKCSQSVFAKYLNVSVKTVPSWEQGIKKPSGATLRLLSLIEKQPEVLFPISLV